MVKRYYTTRKDHERAKELARAAGFIDPEAIDKDHPTSRACPIYLRFIKEAVRLNDEEKKKCPVTQS